MITKQIIAGPVEVETARITEYDAARLGSAIRTARQVNGLSLRKLQKITGVSFGHLSHVERGEYKVRLCTFIRICTALDMTPSLVLDAITKGPQ